MADLLFTICAAAVILAVAAWIDERLKARSENWSEEGRGIGR